VQFLAIRFTRGEDNFKNAILEKRVCALKVKCVGLKGV